MDCIIIVQYLELPHTQITNSFFLCGLVLFTQSGTSNPPLLPPPPPPKDSEDMGCQYERL